MLLAERRVSVRHSGGIVAAAGLALGAADAGYLNPAVIGAGIAGLLLVGLAVAEAHGHGWLVGALLKRLRRSR